MTPQLVLDFSKTPIDSGKREKRRSFTCSEELQTFLDLLVGFMGTDRSNLIRRYVVEGMQRDIANRLLPQPHLNKSLATIIKEGFA
jgi:hypothetical protein